MKKKICIIFVLFCTCLFCFAQSEKTEAFQDPKVPFRLFETRNAWNYIMLDTVTGKMWITTPSTMILEGYATETYTQTVTVKGLYLGSDITATLSSADGVFSIDKTNISKSAAVNGTDITVTWSPATAGTYSAILTLSSTGAEDEVISITGVAEAAIPTILAEYTDLEFSTMLNESQSKEIAVSGRFLSGDVTVSLIDPNHVFSVSPSTLTVMRGEEALTPLTVTFNSASEGSFTGSVTLSSVGAEDVIISLSAMANDGGTASDAYLDIAKYATIDEAGWNTAYVNKLYEFYTRYQDVEDFSKVVTINDIERKDWNLSPNRYIDYHKEDVCPYSEVLQEFKDALRAVQEAEAAFRNVINS